MPPARAVPVKNSNYVVVRSRKMDPAFGHFKPKGSDAILFKAMQCGLGIGKIKKIFAKQWKKKNSDAVIDVHYHGLKMRLQPYNNTIETKILFSAKKREKAELDCLRPFIKNGGTFLDIGANIGYYSLMAAQMGAQKILAFEPNPTLHKRLETMAGLNGFDQQITVCNFGLGDKKKSLELTLGDDDLGSSSTRKKDMSGEKITIHIQPLIDVLTEQQIEEIDAMKIDVEGMEDEVLFPFFDKAPKELYPKMIIIEDNNDLWERNILEWLLSNSYTTQKITNGNYVLVKS